MNSNTKSFVLASALVALGGLVTANAGVGAVQGQLGDRGGSSSSNSAPPSAPAPSYSPSSASSSEAPATVRRSESRRGERQRAESSGNESSRSESSRSGRGLMGGSLSRNPPGNPGGGNGGGGGSGNGNHGGGHGDHDNDHGHRPPRQVYVLPPLYRDYYWGGDRYYTWDGFWYRSYGGSYISVGPPYGLFVSSLPGYSTSFYYGDSRYYRYDDTYYIYDNSRRGYVVAPSPYDDEEEYDDAADVDMFVYPAQGQSEQQQADDRYACHRWAVKESSYDPIDDEYDPERRANYTRAITACLTGRGYSVR
jgi:hypothetical protein